MRIALTIEIPSEQADRELGWAKALAIEKHVRAFVGTIYPHHAVSAVLTDDDGQVLA